MIVLTIFIPHFPSHFVIVEFPMEKRPGERVAMAIISSTWIVRENNKDFCTWPAYIKFTVARNKVLRKHTPLKAEGCDKILINIKYRSDDFLKAVRKIEQLKEKSDIFSTENETGNERRKNFRHSNFSDDLNSDSNQILSAPKQEKTSQSIFSFTSKFGPSISRQEDCTFEKEKSLSLKAERQTSRSEPIEYKEKSPLTMTTHESGSIGSICTNACNCAKNTVLLEQLLRISEGVSEDVKYIKMIQEQTTMGDVEIFYEKFDILSRQEDLERFNEELADSSELSNMCKVFETVGGKDYKETTRRVLTKMISNDLAKRTNWTGQHDCIKFQQYENIINLIVVSVRRNPSSKNVSKKDIETIIKSWLRYAADRDGGRTKRKPPNTNNATVEVCL